MPSSPYEYGKWVEEALRQVVRRSLEQATQGMLGGHHFYITFRTDAPGIEIPAYLHAQYPREMTIVLQHQYWDLKVFESHFQISLSFNRVNETLSIPFAALTAFADPSVNFGLQLKMAESANQRPATELSESAPSAAPTAKQKKPGSTATGDAPTTNPAPVETPAPKAARKKAAAGGTEPEGAQTSAEVIAFDAFKKK